MTALQCSSGNDGCTLLCPVVEPECELATNTVYVNQFSKTRAHGFLYKVPSTSTELCLETQAECQIIMHTSGLKTFRTATKMTGYVKARLMSMDLANVLE